MKIGGGTAKRRGSVWEGEGDKREYWVRETIQHVCVRVCETVK